MGDADALPDYVLDPNAVLNDKAAAWRHGAPPDYSKTGAFYEETKQMTHEAGSLPDLVSNLVKNWEIEASFKTSLDDWRTIDHSKYTFSLNNGPPQTGDHMLRVGTYNAILTSSAYYDPEHNDFSTSHKAFKRMMPTFAWEVLEVRGEKVTVKAHGGLIDIQGIVIAKVNSSLQLEKIDVWFDPMDMFRQIAREEKVEGENKEGVDAAGAAAGCPVLGHGSV
ncbi:hypothetical protein LV164_006335 [Aspergillus fumigatus]|nr:hypothetical protein KXX42_002470 [Aspergillus fumigatus]KAH1982779.1 hypothetical protein KXW88_003971 [Aspergillus fumigatus]KAH2304691.1 hypothetical protein KXV47_008941 [Aspergillus fumigatus]KAH2770241.1 hypothetical protein KXV94_006991 [Aspergillus fumigatus]KAH3142426.1 hypothetical protein KXW18_000985 [Aspergillus fumigatus]